MSIPNEYIYITINFLLNSDLSIMYKKVVLKKYIDNYINDTNKDNIINILKNNNNDIYDYIFLNPKEKIKKYNKSREIKRKEYYENNKEKICEKGKLYYQEHKEHKLLKNKEYQERKKQEKLKQKEEENNNE